MLWKDLYLLYRLSTSLLLVVTYLEVGHFYSTSDRWIKLKKYHPAPALVGDVVLWKPSPAATTYSNYLVHQIFTESGVPPGVIRFVPGPPPEVVAQAINHISFAALHFTGSTFVFKKLWKDIAMNLDKYRGYPRIVGEMGGKNSHVIHQSAEIRNAVRSASEGCSFFFFSRMPIIAS